jgi:hypothetical protein
VRPTCKILSGHIRALPVEVPNKHSAAATHEYTQVTVPHLERPSTSTGAPRVVAELNERIGAWVNEGGAGGEVNR